MTAAVSQSSPSQADTSSPTDQGGDSHYGAPRHTAPEVGHATDPHGVTPEERAARAVPRSVEAEANAALAEMTDAEAQEHADEMDPVYPGPAEDLVAPPAAPEIPKRVDPKTLPSSTEVSDGFVHLKWRGLSWEFPVRRGSWDMNVQFAFEEGLRNRGLFTLLGGGPEFADVARAKLYSVATTKDELDDFTDFVSAAMLEHCE